MRGKRAPAESAFVRAGAEHAPDSLTAALNLAVLHFDRGERDRAMKEFDHFIDVYNASGGANLTSDELVAVATAVEYLGANDPQLFKDALKAFDRALSTDPLNADAKVKLGELFLRKYNFADAQTTFDDVLQTNPNNPRALLGAAMRLAGRRTGRRRLAASRGAERSIPSTSKRARCTREMLLESRGLRRRAAGHRSRAARSIRRRSARSRWPRRSSISRTIKPGFEAMRQRALALDPNDAELYSTLAELAAQVRLYKRGGRFREAGRRARPQELARVERARHEPDAPRPDRRRAQESRDVVRGRSVQRVGQEHARPARHIQEL